MPWVQSDRTFGHGLTQHLLQVFLSPDSLCPAPGFPAGLAASTGGAGGVNDEARRKGWRRMRASTATWMPGRPWQRRPPPPPAPPLRGAPGWRWTVRPLGSATLWAGSSGGMARRNWSRPGGWPSEGSPCHTGSEERRGWGRCGRERKMLHLTEHSSYSHIDGLGQWYNLWFGVLLTDNLIFQQEELVIELLALWLEGNLI